MNKDVNILLVGDDTFDIYVKAFYQGFKKSGYTNAHLFATNHYMTYKTWIGFFLKKAENKLAFGPRIENVNYRLLQAVRKSKPEVIFFYTARLIYAKTIRKIKEMGIKVMIYNNDDPFASYFPRYFWRHFRRSLKYADVGFVFRHKNIVDYQRAGCRRVELLRAYYIEERNYHVENPPNIFPKVVFIGHCEKDERQQYIKRLLDEEIEVGVPKNTWEAFEEGNPYLVKIDNCFERYNAILNDAKIAIVFLSKINNDTYTTRCFEIPVVKTLMFAPYNEDLASMFDEDKEIVFYRNEDEFVEKIKYYLENDMEREKIIEAAYRRVKCDGHEVADRVQFVMGVYKEINEDK